MIIIIIIEINIINHDDDDDEWLKLKIYALSTILVCALISMMGYYTFLSQYIFYLNYKFILK